MNGAAGVPRYRRWVGLLVIVAGVFLVLLAVWPGGLVTTGEADPGRAPVLWFATNLGGGAAALAATFLVRRSRALARGVLAAGGIVVLSKLLVTPFDALALFTTLLPGVVLLGCAPFLAPVPRPEQEKPPGA